jgi:hypothetical protein
MTERAVPRVGDWVEVRPLDEVRATLDGAGELEGLPFMPEMVRHCGQRRKVAAVMNKICGGGPGMRTVRGEPLVLLEDLRCDGQPHGSCSRECTLLWKPAWLGPAGGDRGGPGEPAAAPVPWPYPVQAPGGAWQCQATALARATDPVSTPRKLLSALDDVRQGEWSLGSMAAVYLETLEHKLGSVARRAGGLVAGRGPTPVEVLGLRPGDWVQVKTLGEISATLDRHRKNRGLEFSRYMIPFCGGTYRVRARMGNFIDENTGAVRRLENTVLLEGVACGGETTSGPCRRAEYLYWREIWLRRAPGPPAGR